MKTLMAIVLVLCIGLVGGAVGMFVWEHGRLPQRGEVRKHAQEKASEIASNLELLKKLHDQGYEANQPEGQGADRAVAEEARAGRDGSPTGKHGFSEMTV